jgi:hypothetical protein
MYIPTVNTVNIVNIFVCRYGWDDQYYEYDESGEGWYQDAQGEWHQETAPNQSNNHSIFVLTFLLSLVCKMLDPTVILAFIEENIIVSRGLFLGQYYVCTLSYI